MDLSVTSLIAASNMLKKKDSFQRKFFCSNSSNEAVKSVLLDSQNIAYTYVTNF